MTQTPEAAHDYLRLRWTSHAERMTYDEDADAAYIYLQPADMIQPNVVRTEHASECIHLDFDVAVTWLRSSCSGNRCYTRRSWTKRGPLHRRRWTAVMGPEPAFENGERRDSGRD